MKDSLEVIIGIGIIIFWIYVYHLMSQGCC